MDKVQQPIEAARVIDEDLYELLLILQNTKTLHRNICSRMRKKGVCLEEDLDSDFNNSVDEMIMFASHLAYDKLYFDIRKGPER